MKKIEDLAYLLKEAKKRNQPQLAKTGQESEDLFSQSFAKYQKAVELGGSCYNLACWYALRKNKDNALLWLEESLKRQEITTDFCFNG